MSRRQAHPPGYRAGLTLIELVMSLAILTVLLAAMTSAILLTARALPATDAPAIVLSVAQSVLDRLASELEHALYIIESTPTSIAFTVPDRDGDGRPERIRYSWSAIAGQPLERHYNDSSAQLLLDRTDLFALACDFLCVSEPYPGVAVEDTPDTLLAETGDDAGLQGDEIRSDRAWGQYLQPVLDSRITSWRPTRVKFRARSGDTWGRTYVQLRRPDVHLQPASSVLCQETLEWFELPTSWSWVEKTFGTTPSLPLDSGVCLVLQYHWALGDVSARVQYDGNTPFGLQASSDAQQWSFDNTRSFRCQLYGRLTRSGPTQYVFHRYVQTVRIDLKPSITLTPVLSTRIRLLNCPEWLSDWWEADFSSDPTALDNNGDGLGDFVRADGQPFNLASLSGGLWQADAVLLTRPSRNFSGLAVLEARMRATSPGGKGAVVWLHGGWAADGSAVGVEVSLRQETDRTQTLEVIGRTGDQIGVSLVTVPGLPAGWTDLELWLNTQAPSVHVRVNGVWRGTYACSRFVPTSSLPGAGLTASGATAQFDRFRLRVLEVGP